MTRDAHKPFRHIRHVVAFPPKRNSHAFGHEQGELLLAAVAALDGNSLHDLAIVRSSVAGG